MAESQARTKYRPHQPDETEQLLLNAMQSAFPLVSRPYEELAKRIGTDEADVMRRIEVLKEGQILRQVSAIFDSRRLGYNTSLVAMQFDEANLEAGAAIISLHPGVSHNYKRNHKYNLWFTIAAPPQKTIEGEVALLAEKAKPVKTWLLPTLKLFKIGVNLDVTGQSDIAATEADADNLGLRSARNWKEQVENPTLTADELTAIRLLQLDLPVTPNPFLTLVQGTELTEARLLELAELFLERKQMRRFAAVLHHRKVGFRANAMGVWVVPEDRIEEVGQKMASFKAVSHCYRRPTYPDWPYSVFTMIHGRHSSDCEDVVEAISEATGIDEYALLYSTKEYKKTRVRYFVDDDAFDANELPERETAGS